MVFQFLNGSTHSNNEDEQYLRELIAEHPFMQELLDPQQPKLKNTTEEIFKHIDGGLRMLRYINTDKGEDVLRKWIKRYIDNAVLENGPEKTKAQNKIIEAIRDIIDDAFEEAFGEKY